MSSAAPGGPRRAVSWSHGGDSSAGSSVGDGRGRAQPGGAARNGANRDRLSRGRIDFSARDHASDVPLARYRERRGLVAHRRLVRRRPGDDSCHLPGRAHAHRQARSGLRRRYQPASAPTGRALLDAGPRDLAGHQAAFGRARRNGRHYRFSCRPGGLAWKGLHTHFPGCGGRAHLLSRRAVDALGAGKGRHQTPGRRGHSAGRLEDSQRGRSPQPRGDG